MHWSALTAKLQQSNSVSVGKESRSESNCVMVKKREREGCTWLLLLFALDVVVAVVAGYC